MTRSSEKQIIWFQISFQERTQSIFKERESHITCAWHDLHACSVRPTQLGPQKATLYALQIEDLDPGVSQFGRLNHQPQPAQAPSKGHSHQRMTHRVGWYVDAGDFEANSLHLDTQFETSHPDRRSNKSQQDKNRINPRSNKIHLYSLECKQLLSN